MIVTTYNQHVRLLSPSPLVGSRLQSLLGHGSRHCLWNHYTHLPNGFKRYSVTRKRKQSKFECNRLCLLKKSFVENSQKKLCDRKPSKRRSPFCWTFSISQILAVLTKHEFFNSVGP